MSKKLLKTIVAIWSIVISLESIIGFFSGPLEWQRIPFVGILLLVVGILLLVPKFANIESVLMIVALVFFGYFVVVGVIGFIKGVGNVELKNLFVYIANFFKSIIFVLIPAVLSLLYFTHAKKA